MTKKEKQMKFYNNAWDYKGNFHVTQKAVKQIKALLPKKFKKVVNDYNGQQCIF